MLRAWAAMVVVAWTCKAFRNELYRIVGSDLTPQTAYSLQRTSLPSMAMCSELCLEDPACMGFTFSAVASDCTSLQGSLVNVLASTTDAQGYNIYWKASNQTRGFARYGAKAYMYFPFNLPIGEARQACEELYGSLALPLENKWVHLIAPDTETWLPINDMTWEGFWGKDAGGTLNYTNWAEGEPNDLNSEDCAVVGKVGQWNDVSCSLLRTYVCEVVQDHCDTGKWDIRCTYV